MTTRAQIGRSLDRDLPYAVTLIGEHGVHLDTTDVLTLEAAKRSAALQNVDEIENLIDGEIIKPKRYPLDGFARTSIADRLAYQHADSPDLHF